MRLRVPLTLRLVVLMTAACTTYTQMPVPEQQAPIALGTAGSAPLAFTRVVIRIPSGTEVGAHYYGLMKEKEYPYTWATNLTVASDEFRVIALEQLRNHGYHVMGGDNLLFGDDESAKAEYQLGGTLTQLTVNTFAKIAGNYSEASIVVEWQLYDALLRQVVFSRATQGYAKRHGTDSPVIQDPFRSALTNLMASADFVAAVRHPLTEQPTGSVASETSVSISACPDTSRALPKDLQSAFDAVVIIRAGSTTGSGVIVSEDGYAVTAAHVVSGLGEVPVSLHSGLQLTAQVVSVDVPQDVALIRLPGRRHACLPVAGEAAPPVGTEIYAIGAPAGEAFAYSVTKGIISGYRGWSGFSYLQTDASLNPGNSGGPILTHDGRVVGVVSWKVTAPGFEGLAFGVPINALSKRLGLRWK